MPEISEAQALLSALLYGDARRRYGYDHAGATWFVLAVVWGGHEVN